MGLLNLEKIVGAVLGIVLGIVVTVVGLKWPVVRESLCAAPVEVSK